MKKKNLYLLLITTILITSSLFFFNARKTNPSRSFERGTRASASSAPETLDLGLSDETMYSGSTEDYSIDVESRMLVGFNLGTILKQLKQMYLRIINQKSMQKKHSSADRRMVDLFGNVLLMIKYLGGNLDIPFLE